VNNLETKVDDLATKLMDALLNKLGGNQYMRKESVKEANALLVVDTMIGGKKLKALVDSGSEKNHIKTMLAKAMALPLRRKKYPYTLVQSDGKLVGNCWERQW
jgi:hypothetical protein